MKAAASGGETPIADTRKVLARISASVRNKFIADGYRYVRNFGNGLGLSWQTAFQTGDRRAVEDYCRRNDIEWEWKGGDRLRTSQVRPVLARHPVSSEPVWFNHATFFHVYTLDPMIRSRLLNDFGIEDFPNNTYYGDGSEIDPDIMCELRSAYEEEKVTFQWHEGDVLMLDNMLVAHGRGPYKGARKVVVGMSGSCSWSNVSLSQEGRR
jgi:alpha-ketoglutarate-dependent taurine dioxygenase